LCVPAKAAKRPSWADLYETASAQAGYFTTKQAAEAGYSLPLIHTHLKAGRMQRIRRGIYRLVHFPAGEHEELVIVWLWSDQAGVFSHQTALALHELSDALPAKVHITLPAAWAGRRLKTPTGVVVHHGDVPKADRAWFGPVPVTSPRRTLLDSARDHVSPELLQQAARQATKRGLVVKRDLVEVRRALRSFGGATA
jgi:predicted transcriptional regulator of viral defense system